MRSFVLRALHCCAYGSAEPLPHLHRLLGNLYVSLPEEEYLGISSGERNYQSEWLAWWLCTELRDLWTFLAALSIVGRMIHSR